MAFKLFKRRDYAPETWLAWLYIVAGMVGLKASFALTIDKFDLLKNPNFTPSCSINPIISCGTVMKTAQASVFGFDDTLIGLVAFAALITVGVSMLAGGRHSKWFWRLFVAVAAGGTLFAHWLLYEAIFNINAVCPWCLTVDAVVIPLFWYTLLYSLKQNILPTPKPLTSLVEMVQRYKHVILVLWYLGIALTILLHFWYYFKTVI